MTAAEWTPEQCAAFNAGQQRRDRHPYTCGTDSRHRVLVATRRGLACPDCDYRQFWAHGLPDLRPPADWYGVENVRTRLRRREAGEPLRAVYASGPGADPDDLGGAWAERLSGRDEIIAVREWLAAADREAELTRLVLALAERVDGLVEIVSRRAELPAAEPRSA